MNDNVKIVQLLDSEKIKEIIKAGKVKLPKADLDDLIEVITDSISILSKQDRQRTVSVSCSALNLGCNFELVAKFSNDNTEWLSYTGREMQKHYYTLNR